MRPDLRNLWTIIEYCDSIRDDIRRFGTDVEDSLSDKAYRRSVSFSVIQIMTRNIPLMIDLYHAGALLTSSPRAIV